MVHGERWTAKQIHIFIINTEAWHVLLDLKNIQSSRWGAQRIQHKGVNIGGTVE